MEESGWVHTPATFAREKIPGYPLHRRVPQKEKKLLPILGIEPGLLGPPPARDQVKIHQPRVFSVI
jgi:hypothetical protein